MLDIAWGFGVCSIQIYFDFFSPATQKLKLNLFLKDGSNQVIFIHARGGELSVFDKKINILTSEILKINIESGGIANKIGENDERYASLYIRNLSIKAINR